MAKQESYLVFDTKTEKVKLVALEGCLCDSTWGILNIRRVLEIARAFGWDGKVPTDDDIRGDVMGYHMLSEEATEWLNANVAEDGYIFGWNEGEYYYLPSMSEVWY